MTFVTKQFFSWMLVLIMAISPVQVTMAVDFDQSSHGSNCQSMMSDSIDSIVMNMDEECAMEHEEHCHDHPGCVGQFNSSTLQAPNALQLAVRASTLVKFLIDNEAVSTIYPPLLKRPPKA